MDSDIDSVVLGNTCASTIDLSTISGNYDIYNFLSDALTAFVMLGAGNGDLDKTYNIIYYTAGV